MKIETALTPDGDIQSCGETAQILERIGFDALYTYDGAHDAFMPIALASRTTSRVELGTGVAIAFARNPMTCAQLANDLHLLTRGRFVLGLGAQVKADIETRFSQVWSRPAERMHEFVRAVRAIWDCWHAGTPLDFRGDFYTHTLMRPTFNPGANRYGRPKIFLGAVGPRMLQTVGEVADGMFVSPFNTPDYALEVLLPGIEKGLSAAGRVRDELEISCQTIVMLGTSEEQLDKARESARSQLAFHLTLPAYKSMIDLNRWGDLLEPARRFADSDDWASVRGLVSDDMLDRVGVCGDPCAVGAAVRVRNSFADRTGIVVHGSRDREVLSEVVRGFRDA